MRIIGGYTHIFNSAIRITNHKQKQDNNGINTDTAGLSRRI